MGEIAHLDFVARIYNPSLGRFLSIDLRSLDIAGFSPYGFALNNPNVYTEPSGEIAVIPFLLKAGAAEAADMLMQAVEIYLFEPEVETFCSCL